MAKSKPSHLYVIRQYGSNVYWNNSAEHGCGWNPHYPKQAFSKSELVAQINELVRQEHFCTVVITELDFPSVELEGSNPSQCLTVPEVATIKAPTNAKEKCWRPAQLRDIGKACRFHHPDNRSVVFGELVEVVEIPTGGFPTYKVNYRSMTLFLKNVEVEV